MLTLDLKSRLKNKTFILSMLGAIVLLVQQLGFKDLIPSNWLDIVNTILSILVMLGIVVDTSTPGVSDKVNEATEQAIKSAEIKEAVKTETSTTAINNVVTEHSQGSNIESNNLSINMANLPR